VLAAPARRNAMSPQMAADLSEIMRQALAEGCRALVLTGEGSAFCAGAAIDALDPTQPGYDAGMALETHYNPLLRTLRDLPIPVIAAVNGAAAGIGCSLALYCDIVLASEAAQFIQPFVRIGLVPDTGVTFLLTHALGRARTMELMLLGEPLSAREAKACGLVNRVCSPALLMGEAQNMASRLAAGPAEAIALTRAQVDQALENGFEAMLALERAQQTEAGSHPDHAEGLAAFRERRSPRFAGSAATAG
jgi:2-(1,2-epoxy-1,2-dihydrophenyl)acetyl-CoA isomerase